MPTSITPYQCGVWFLVGLLTSMGWALGSIIVTRLFGLVR
jgi:hypothetical protein